MGLTGQNAFYTACAYLHGPVFVFGEAISVSLRWTAVAGTNPLSLLRWTASSPFCRLSATSSPGRGKSFEGRALGRTSKFRPHRSTAGRSLLLSCKLYAFAKASTFGGGGISRSEMTERVASGTNPLSLAALDSCCRDEPSQSPTATALPKGEPLAKRGSFVLTGQRQEEACR